MNRLKSKASQFFQNSPTQDENVAITATDQEADFSAGIERSLRKKPSRFFRKQKDKPLPSPPYLDPSEGPPPPLPKDHDPSERADAVVSNLAETAETETDKSLQSPPASRKSASSKTHTSSDKESHDAARKTKQHPVLKKRPSFASLRKSSSRVFRSNTEGQDPPPPPMPQIPIKTPTPKPRRPNLRPFEYIRSARSSRSNQGRIRSISRPISHVQSQLPANFDSYKVPFTEPMSPPPPRPARPGSLDEDLVALARDGGARTILHTPSRARTLTASTVSVAWSPALSRVGSEEAYARLGLPSGHSSLSLPRSPVFDSPLAANFPLDPNLPLPFCDSDGSVLGYGRFSAYVKARQQYGSGGYGDGVEAGDRDQGPLELYRASRCADWTLERRVSGKLGERGMLFRDRWGGWHLVRDI
ncbi:uncharacterized protein M421DRAFT_867 [Didymella exigua CBS 183.55]|uniref:Uncharacterized protein n=1 Tax=Didymella exigua CBS 183.55 TaxID=1150837 RepID=A0A6A5S1J1_9PLEO|nr:uncharacterized protein M421DRAFT_867 [Didymella exigua CBS 183.55]KAF1933460.1 hypothetical protein M421DRAFT_867 [Didymella exigua CBS 183.55]